MPRLKTTKVELFETSTFKTALHCTEQERQRETDIDHVSENRCLSIEGAKSSQALIQKECNSISDKITYCFNMLFTYRQYNKKSLLYIVAFPLYARINHCSNDSINAHLICKLTYHTGYSNYSTLFTSI